ncbi:MAG: hypothetical protein LBC86_05175 [Oscillospiraceae bacterium]|jgi:hypothetical protein|nr:hypothetical protein [Oscillospiraceae bacterium]
MEYGFTEEGHQVLAEAQIRDVQQVRRGLELQAQTEIEAGAIGDFRGGIVPDMPQQEIAPPMPETEFVHEPQYEAQRTEQNIVDAPAHLGILTRGLSYDPVEVKHVEKPSGASQPQSGTNYDRFSEPQSEAASFEELLNNQVQEYQQQQETAFQREMQGSLLYRRNGINKYG